ncbi:MAG: prolyl aminopeptidase [Gammaproteobacteria bacterium]|nr:prolyl aminopeptidase [Gammaproteobacteria bacterium]
MRQLYPEIEPFAVHRLAVDTLHEIYVEECGNPDGVPVVFLHGGPGSGCREDHRRYFDPARYRVVLFDQRGCNRSTPRGEVRENSTLELLGDMERIRERLGVRRWLVYGGSWGAALALLYAEAHPDRVQAMILRGAFLARRCDLDWFLRAGVSRIFPDEWTRFEGHVPEAERTDLVGAYHRRLHGPDHEERIAAARAWSRWAGRVTTYLLPESEEEEDTEKTICQVSIETHYAYHRYFIRENQVLEEIGRLPRVPVLIVHGRRDLTCTLDSSWSLHRDIPASVLKIVREGGHLASEPVMIDALVHATDEMAEKLS